MAYEIRATAPYNIPKAATSANVTTNIGRKVPCKKILALPCAIVLAVVSFSAVPSTTVAPAFSKEALAEFLVSLARIPSIRLRTFFTIKEVFQIQYLPP